MANPLLNEDKIYQALKDEEVKVDYRVWELIDHHVRNDLNKVSLRVGYLRMLPDEYLNEISEKMQTLYKDKKLEGEPPEDLISFCDGVQDHLNLVGKWMKNLRDLTVGEKKEI